jgi:DNA end-binding protein Ku
MGELLVLDQLRFADEIRQPEGLRAPEVEVQKRELDMAMALIDQLTDSFEPKKYSDTYTDEMLRVIHEKVEGREPEPGEPEPEISTQVPDLVALLKASLDKPKQGEEEAEAEPKERESHRKKRVA